MNEESTSMTMISDLTFSGGTAVEGAITITCPNQANAGEVRVLYGADPSTLTNTPTAVAYSINKENTLAFGMLGHHNWRLRIVQAGIRIKCISSADTASGVFDCFFSRNVAMSGAGAYHPYSTYCEEHDGNIYNIREGITARGKIGNGSTDFFVAPANQYTHLGANEGVEMPVIRFRGLSATTILYITCVWQVQIESNSMFSPLTYDHSLDYEPELELLIHRAEHLAHTTTSNSFKSFFSAVKRGLVGAFKFIQKAQPVASAGLKLF
jgi:hypothetical protein